jgi:hypothetical protein
MPVAVLAPVLRVAAVYVCLGSVVPDDCGAR